MVSVKYQDRRHAMHKPLLICAFATLALGGFAIAATASSPKDRRAKILASYQPVGEAKNCVSLHSIRETRIVNDRTIDFHMNGRKVFRNTLPHSCPGLVSEDRFSYRTSQNQLCSVDIVRVLHNYGGGLQEGAGCGLGKFQPVEKVPPAR
jgi:hypothetical protein